MDLDEAEALISAATREAFRSFLERVSSTVFADPEQPDFLVWPVDAWPAAVADVLIPAVVEVFVRVAVDAGISEERARELALTFVAQDLAPVVTATTVPDRVQSVLFTAAGVAAASGVFVELLGLLSASAVVWQPMLGVVAANAAGVAVNAGAFVAAVAVSDFGRRRVTKQWLAHDDERTRVTHVAVDNKVVLVNDTFNVGGFPLRYPHDPFGPVQEVINCRCRLRFGVENG